MAERSVNINDVDPECVPFYLLTKRAREVLQHTANGLPHKEVAKRMGISPKTVEAHIHAITTIGTEAHGVYIDSEYANQAHITMTALIQDGIASGYLKHKLPMPTDLFEPLRPREKEVMGLLLEGMTHQEIAKRLLIAPKTTQIHTTSIRAKLGTNNIYHTVARVAYLKAIRQQMTFAGQQTSRQR